MDFGEILDRWDMQTQRPYGKKKLRRDAKNPVQIDPAKENTQRMNPMDRWMNRHGIYDKDAENAEETGAGENFAEKRKLRAMRPQAEIDLHGMTLEEAYAALVAFFEDAVQ